MMKMRALGIVGTFVLALASAACGGDDEGAGTGAPAGTSENGGESGASSASDLDVATSPSAIVRRSSGGAISVVAKNGSPEGMTLAIEGLPSGIAAHQEEGALKLSFSGEPAFGEHAVKVRVKSGAKERELAVTLLVAEDAGVLDATFASKGLLAGAPSLKSQRMTLDAQGRALVPAMDASKKAFLARYTSAGEPDTTFDGDGLAPISFDAAKPSFAISIASKGEDTFVGGMTGTSLAEGTPCVAKVDASGKPAAGFGKGGVACFASPMIGEYGVIADIVPQGDGSTLALGLGGKFTESDVFVLKLTAAGELDGAFGVGGIARWASPTGEQAMEMMVDAEGRIVIAGMTNDSATQTTKPLVLRLTKSGQPDAWFGSAGVATIERGVDLAGAFTMALGGKGEIYLAGMEADGAVIYALDPANGAPLASFGDGGARVYPELGAGAFHSLVWDDGKLLASGHATIADAPAAVAVRVSSADGAFDASFATGGTMKLPVGTNATALAVAPSSRAFILAESPTGYVVARAWR